MSSSRWNYYDFIVAIFAAALCFTLLGCQPLRISKILEGPKPAGFEQIGPVAVYNRTNLFDFMDGEAESYFPFGFRLLYTQIYRSEQTDARMVVEIYDMTTRKGSTSVYREYSARGGSIIQGVGESAWTDRWLLLLREGPYFVRISPDPSRENTVKPSQEDMIALARAIDGLLR
jgi:Family of unknown function (DUF6599)